MGNWTKRFRRDDSGAAVVEYCFIAGLIAIAVVTGITAVGTKLNFLFTQLAAVN